MLCPHCDHEINDDTADILDGICPQCEGSITGSGNLWDDNEDYDREYEEDDFDVDIEEEIKEELGTKTPKGIIVDDIDLDDIDEDNEEDEDEDEGL